MDHHMKIADDEFLRSVDYASEDLKNRKVNIYKYYYV